MWFFYTCVTLITVYICHINSATVSVDSEMSKAIEEAITSDEFVISIGDIQPNKRKKHTETLFIIEFPGTNQKFSLQLDRESKQAIANYKLNTIQESRRFALKNLTEDSVINSLLLHVKQSSQSTAQITLYANCVSYGTIKPGKTLREVYMNMRNPQLLFSHEKKYAIDVDSDLNVNDVLLQNGCTSEMQASQPSSSRNQIGHRPPTTTTLRSDLPPPSECDYNSDCCSVKINLLVELITKLQQELSSQRSETQQLLRTLSQCNFCRPTAYPLVTCSGNQSICFPGVSCKDTPDGQFCGPCPAGYVGDGHFCQPVSPCQANPCYPGVSCTDLGATEYQCGPCPAGFMGDGKKCHRQLCSLSPCYPGVACRELEDGYQCGPCPDHFTGNGQNCYRLWCDQNPCYPGVDCVNTAVGGFKCGACPKGHSGNGTHCSRITVITCEMNPCYPGVDCINYPGGYRCGLCPKGYSGDGVHCAKVSIVSSCDSHPCYPGVDCINTVAGFQCGPCPPRYTGDGIRCDPLPCTSVSCFPEPPLPMVKCPANSCFPGTHCEMSAIGPKCGPCPEGFTGDGIYCKPIISCKDKPCYPGVNCRDYPGGFQCDQCPVGYRGDGRNCTRIYTCRDRLCYPGVECIDVEDDYRCGSCPLGYTGDGRSCVRIYTCADNPCHPGVICHDTEEGISCGSCPEGFTGDGRSCRRIITCREMPCYPGVACRDTKEGPKCGHCKEGYTGDGRSCARIITCEGHPCFPGVECKNSEYGYICGSCPDGMKGDGKWCTKELSPCEKAACKPGSPCSSKPDVPCKRCPDAGQGGCLTSPCDPNPCLPGSKCYPIPDSPYYRCESCPFGTGLNGSLCVDVDECLVAEPCDPQVRCYNLKPGFRCDSCPPGYTGNQPHGIGVEYALRNKQNCIDIDECAYNNGGCQDICVNTQGSYRCSTKICQTVCSQNVTYIRT